MYEYLLFKFTVQSPATRKSRVRTTWALRRHTEPTWTWTYSSRCCRACTCHRRSGRSPSDTTTRTPSRTPCRSLCPARSRELRDRIQKEKIRVLYVFRWILCCLTAEHHFSGAQVTGVKLNIIIMKIRYYGFKQMLPPNYSIFAKIKCDFTLHVLNIWKINSN